MRILARLSLGIGAAALFAGCGGSQPLIGIPGATTDRADSVPYHKTFHYTGSEQSFIVPKGVRELSVVARGAAGAGQSGSYRGDYYEYFGRGGRVDAVLPVKPGETLYVLVGGQGSTVGGYNGGGDPGSDPSGTDHCYGGGGASDVRQKGPRIRHRVLIAAGGGGEGCTFNGDDPSIFGGKGGPAVGENGGSYHGAVGGSGGTQHYGGAGGAGGGSGTGSAGSGHSGVPGRGGKGGRGGLNYHCDRSDYFCGGGGGGGGGGGYYGGGGGGGGAGYNDYAVDGAGGGGGSSFVERNAIKARFWRGWKTANGNGIVVFSWK